jgi:ribosome-associated translation inhibitor RaiA
MITSFNPVNFSDQENEFLLKHLGKPSSIALREIKGVINPHAHPKDKNPIIYPDGVIPASVKPVLDGIYELQDLEKQEGLNWVGLDKVKETISIWLRENAKWRKDHQLTRGRAPRYPSLWAWDAKGKGHLGGPGSDSGMIKTYFGPSGERIPFEIELLKDYIPSWTAPSVTDQQGDKRLFVDADSHRIECRVPMPDGTLCGHTESYKQDSRSSYNAARARISKHLRKATTEVEAHRELHTLEFGN